MVISILANSAEPDEMQHYAAFHLGLHCLPKYPFRGFQYTKSLYSGGLSHTYKYNKYGAAHCVLLEIIDRIL